MAPCQSVSLEMDALEGAGWNTGALRLTLVAGAAARLEARSVEAFGRRFDKVVLTCSRFSSERGIWRCEDGTIEAGTPAAGTPGAPQKIGVTASFDPARHELALELLPEPGERWVFTQRAGDNLLKLDNAALARLAGWLPGATKPSAGRVQGEVRWNAASVSTDLRFKGLGFADNTGLRAGENLAGGLTLTANLADGKWRWRTRLGWDSGALLIDPLYIAEGGHALDAEGELVGQALGVTRAALDFKGLGRLEMTGAADLAADALGDWTIKADDLALAGVRAILPQAWLEQHGLADLTLAGRGALALAGDAAGLARARVTLSGASAGAATRRLVLGGVDLAFDYAPGATRPFLLALQHLQVGGLKFGPVKAAGEVRDGRLYLPTLAAPVQDGALTLRDIEVGRSNGFWNARLAGGFGPLSMEKLSAALEWHPMRGAVSGVLPQMHYEESVSGSIFSVDGALGFKVFGGDASVDAIRIAPFLMPIS